MKVALSVTGSDLSSQVDARFGRAHGFLFVDPDSMQYEYWDNPNAVASGGAGISTARAMVEHGVHAIITGNVGPNAFQVLEAAGIAVYAGASGSAAEALGAYKEGSLTEMASASVAEHFGIRGGGAPAGGRGGPGAGGRGQGRGRRPW